MPKVEIDPVSMLIGLAAFNGFRGEEVEQSAKDIVEDVKALGLSEKKMLSECYKRMEALIKENQKLKETQ